MNKPLVHTSMESEATARAKIREKEMEHWASGLRQAILEADQLRRFLKRTPWWMKVFGLSPDRYCARHLLDVYETERSRIEQEHAKELQGLTFEEYQEKYASAMQVAIEAKYIAADIFARQNNVSEGSALLLISRTPEEQSKILERMYSFLGQAEIAALTNRIMRTLSAMSPEERARAVYQIEGEFSRLALRESEVCNGDR